MAWWQVALDAVGLVAFLTLAAGGVLFLRRRLLARSGGTFECSVRVDRPAAGSASGGRGWMIGLARYGPDRLEWFRVFSLSPRPKFVFDRSMQVSDRRLPDGPEAFSLYAGHVVVTVTLPSSDHQVELAMSDSALTGFLAWTEAGPPGHPRLFDL